MELDKFTVTIEQICRSLPVKRLGLFGSVLTGRFSEQSDVDVLVSFESDPDVDLFDVYFTLKERLEQALHREVDLVVERPFRNPIFREAVQKSKTVIYERRD